MKYYVNVEQKDHLCPRGFQRERRRGSKRKEDIGHLFGLPNLKIVVSAIAEKILRGWKGLWLIYFFNMVSDAYH